MITYLGFEGHAGRSGAGVQGKGLFADGRGAVFETALEDWPENERVLGCKEQNELCGAATSTEKETNCAGSSSIPGREGRDRRPILKVIGERITAREMTVQTLRARCS